MEEKRNNQTKPTVSADLSEPLDDQKGRSDQLPKLLLASTSPRRSEILRLVGWDFEVGAVEVDESIRANENAREYVERLAAAKAAAASAVHALRPALAADTTVVVDGEILAKPEDVEDAKRMLRMLAGRWHEVLTAIALVTEDETKVACERTEVKFAPMSDDEINWYVSTGEPMDKAGAYAIQGRGARFIEAIKGDYFNVMGLPLRLVYEMVRTF
jgi:septum formation protein